MGEGGGGGTCAVGALNDCAAKQANIVQILERVSRHLQIKGNMPNQRRFKEMQDELEYKKVQVQNAAMTSDRLREEREMRQQARLYGSWVTGHGSHVRPWGGARCTVVGRPTPMRFTGF